MTAFPKERIRNFCIIAHIDHGKTTLSDAIMRRTGLLNPNGTVATYLDKLEVEKQRGITIKAQSCSLFVKPDEDKEDIYLLNLIDTPGHVDFAYEVSRSISVCEGAVLLVDAKQGIEAQTMANLQMALDKNATVVPALTKVDSVLHTEEIDEVLGEMEDNVAVLKSEVVMTSAREQLGIEELLKAIVKLVPPPKGDLQKPFRALVFDAWPEPASETLTCLIRVVDGSVKARDKIHFIARKQTVQVKEIGVMYPEPIPTATLQSGQVGYVSFTHPSQERVGIGDTLSSDPKAELVAQFKTMSPVVFAGVYPDKDADPLVLQASIDKLMANDPSITISTVSCEALGRGYQLGFLGMLHMKVFQERLETEYNQTVLLTPATVTYRFREEDGTEHDLTAAKWQEVQSNRTKIQFMQPVVTVTLTAPMEYVSPINTLAMEYHGMQVDFKTLRKGVCLVYKMPLASMARGFFERLKKTTSGFASMEYDEPEYEECDLAKLDIYVNRVRVDALSVLCLKDETYKVGRRVCQALRSHIPRMVLDIPITAQLGGKIIARETVAGIRKDVTHKCHAGDPTRKMKLLDNQKNARKKLASRLVGGVELDQNALLAAMQAI
eukprot:PhM_4_TR11977/c0_g2_i1/m.83914/K03596/lepA; GTP-binding protein LepA